MAEIAVLERTAVLRHGRRLEYFTIAWNAFESLVAVVAGAILEPATSCVTGRRSNQLNYAPAN